MSPTGNRRILLLLACLVYGQVAIRCEVGTTSLEAQDIGLSTTASPKSFSTRFEGIESPLSEVGMWPNNGLDWTKIRKKNGVAFGTQTGTNTGIYRYDDSYAHLSGFPPDQEAWGEARILKPNESCNQELEILLRFTSEPRTVRNAVLGITDNTRSLAQEKRWT